MHDVDAIIVKLSMRDLMNQQLLLTPSDVAKRLQMNERTVTQWLRNGHLRGFKIGKEWRVSDVDLDAFIEASANNPNGPPPRSVITGDTRDISDLEARMVAAAAPILEGVTGAAEPFGRWQEEGAGLDRDAGDRSAIEGKGAG